MKSLHCFWICRATEERQTITSSAATRLSSLTSALSPHHRYSIHWADGEADLIGLRAHKLADTAWALFVLSHSTSAFLSFCLFFFSPYLFSACVLRWDRSEAELGAYRAGFFFFVFFFLRSSAALWFCPSLRTHKRVIPSREKPQQSSEVWGRCLLNSRNGRNGWGWWWWWGAGGANIALFHVYLNKKFSVDLHS